MIYRRISEEITMTSLHERPNTPLVVIDVPNNDAVDAALGDRAGTP